MTDQNLPLDLKELTSKGYLAQKILEATENGTEIIRFYLDTMRNTKFTIGSRMKAAEWLANNLWGKPSQYINVSGRGVLAALYSMSDEELERFLEDE